MTDHTHKPINVGLIKNASVRAGFPLPDDATTAKRIDLLEHLIVNPSSTFQIKVKGDSMTGVGIDEGDFILVDRSLSPRSGQIVVAVVDGDYTIKKLDLKNGLIRLVAENPNYSPITTADCQTIEIWGVVVASIKSFIPLANRV